jgi:hypothetical protein
MADQEPRGSYGGGRSWVKWILIYVIVAAVVYLLVWLLFFRDGGYF